MFDQQDQPSKGEPATQSSIDSLDWIQNAIGSFLLSYVLGCSEEELLGFTSGESILSENQHDVIAEFETLRDSLPTDLADDSNIGNITTVWLTQIHENSKTIARALREHSGVVDTTPATHDDIESALVMLAADVYPAFLAPIREDDFMRQVRNYTPHLIQIIFRHPASSSFDNAVLADPTLARAFKNSSTAGGHYAIVFTNVGWGGGVQLRTLPETIFQSVWRTMKHEAIAPQLFMERTLECMATIRALFKGEIQEIHATFAYTGVLMPRGSCLIARHGVVRPIDAAERELAPESLKQQLQGTDESGETVQIGYDGDIVYDYKFPYKLRVSKEWKDGNPPNFPEDMLPSDEFEQDSVRIRFSLMLAVARTGRVQLIPTWRRYNALLQDALNMSWNDPRQGSNNITPTKLSNEEVAQWQLWYDRLNTPETGRIELALNRILRAMAERREMSDVLIDSVIAWENLFGSKDEATLRVTWSLARLLADNTSQARTAMRSELGRIYTLRSNIVHGAANLRPSDYPKCQQALEIAVKAVRELALNRADILGLPTGADRSNALLAE